VAAVPLSEFFEFNIEKSCSISNGENVNDKLRDNCEEVRFPREIKFNIVYHVNTEVPFFSEAVSTIHVSFENIYYGYTHDMYLFMHAQAYMDGYITLNERAGELDPNAPITISAFRNKIDITKSDISNVYVRPSTQLTDLNRASKRIRETYSDHSDFKASWIFIVTWYKVAYYSQGNKVDNFTYHTYI